MTTRITSENITDATIGTGDLASSVPLNTQWQAVVTASTLNAAAGKGYFIDTTSNACTITLTASGSATAGDTVVFKDYARNWGTNAVTFASNRFDGVDGATPSFNTTGQTITMIHMGATKGWSLINQDTTSALGAQFVAATGGTLTTSGSFKIHTFLADSNFVVSNAGNAAGSNKVDYMIVAGGGGSGGYAGGGGGGGGFRASNSTCMPAPVTSPLVAPTGITVTAQTYPITVGAGGAAGNTAGTSSPYIGGQGSNSIFSTITSTGGGGGANNGANGTNGGSGGGAGGEGPNDHVGGLGNTPPVSPSQGNNGGAGGSAPSGRASAGGGGAGAVGTSVRSGDPACGGAGGVGSYMVAGETFAGCRGTTGPVCGARYFSGGGGGGVESAPTIPGGLGSNGAGGAGGGGQAGPNPTTRGNGVAGTANTGGGAGGASRRDCNGPPYGSPQAGGKGIVILRYKYQD